MEISPAVTYELTQEQERVILNAVRIAQTSIMSPAIEAPILKALEKMFSPPPAITGKTLRDELREHQVATNSSDDRMVQVMCDFIEKLDDDGQLEGPWYEWLIEFVADNLVLLPGEDVQPLWRTDIFTDEERSTMVDCVMSEISDDVKGVAHAQLDEEPLIELVGYVVDYPEKFAEYLNIGASGEFDLKSLPGADWYLMIRFGLIDDRGIITAFGDEFRSRWA